MAATDIRNVRALLVADGDVTADVPAERINYFPAAQDSAVPLIVYRELNEVPTSFLTGATCSDNVLIEIQCIARDAATLNRLTRNVVEAIETSGTVQSVGPTLYIEDTDVRTRAITFSYWSTRV